MKKITINTLLLSLLCISSQVMGLLPTPLLAVSSNIEKISLSWSSVDNASGNLLYYARNHLDLERTPDAILHFSCCGRKVLLGSRTGEEHQSLLSALESNIPSAGFYSYGEICPSVDSSQGARFHNHTSVIALLSEMNDRKD